MMQTLASNYLRLIIPVIIVGVIWIWIKWRETGKLMDREIDELKKPILRKSMMGRETIKSIKKSNLKMSKKWLSRDNDLLPCMNNMDIRSIEYWIADELVGIVLYAWPSSLWKYRTERGDLEHTSYSHIFMIEVDAEFRKQGLAEMMFNEVLGETKNISSGVTITSAWDDLTRVCEMKFGFSKYDTNRLVHEYV